MPEQHREPILSAVTELFREFGVEGVAPKLAIIARDCRDDDERKAALDGHPALYLGNFSFPDPLDFRPPTPEESARDHAELERLHDAIAVHPDEYPDDAEFELSNPLLISNTGEIIWGIQCDWGPLDSDAMNLAETFGLREVAAAMVDDAKSAFKNSAVYAGLRAALEKAYADSLDPAK